jgi:hypothetical protein
MTPEPESIRQGREVLAGGRFRPLAFALWMPAAAGLGAVTAWLAGEIEGHFSFAFLLLFPILVGVGVGAANVGLMRIAQMGNRPTAILGVLLSAAVTVAGQHYLDYRQEVAQNLQRWNALGGVAPLSVVRTLVVPPESFSEYLRQQAGRGRRITASWSLTGWGAWLSWAVDGLLVAAAALAMVLPATRQPYCNACRTWYRTIRAGRTPLAVAQQLAVTAGGAIDAPVKRVRFRLSCCQGGCSPTRLELFWETADRRGPASLEAWLDVALRNSAMQALDEEKDEGGRRRAEG